MLLTVLLQSLRKPAGQWQCPPKMPPVQHMWGFSELSKANIYLSMYCVKLCIYHDLAVNDYKYNVILVDNSILYLKCINRQICGYPILQKFSRSCNIENFQDRMSCGMKKFSQRLGK